MQGKHKFRHVVCRQMPVARRRMQGQSMVEYFIVTAMAVLILIEGGNSSAVQTVIDAIKATYEGFTYATGFATTLTGF